MVENPQTEKLTAEEFDRWIPVAEVFRRVIKYLFGHTATANAIGQRLQKGLIRAGAENFAFAEIDSDPGGVIEIERRRWSAVTDLAEAYDLWRSGTIAVIDDETVDALTYFGVKLDPQGVEKMMASLGEASPLPAPQVLPQTEAAAPPASKHAGGAPRKPFWDDLWAAMGALIYEGTIHPGSKSKDIEDAMVQWAIDHDEDLSVPSARTRARKLLEALRKAEKDNN